MIRSDWLMYIFFTFPPLSGQNTVIDSKNDMTYTMWKDVPVPFFMSVYFFNVLNPKEISAGEKPMVEQRGPYVYRYTQGLLFLKRILNHNTPSTICAASLRCCATRLASCIAREHSLLWLCWLVFIISFNCLQGSVRLHEMASTVPKWKQTVLANVEQAYTNCITQSPHSRWNLYVKSVIENRPGDAHRCWHTDILQHLFDCPFFFFLQLYSMCANSLNTKKNVHNTKNSFHSAKL